MNELAACPLPEIRTTRVASNEAMEGIATSLADSAGCNNSSEPNGSESARSSVRAQPLLGRRICYAEDGVENQRLVAWILRRAGAIVEIVEDGWAALVCMNLAACEGRGFDLVLTDVDMPNMDGITLAKRLRISGLRIPILALTAHASVDAAATCTAAGCNAVLVKPIVPVDLLAECCRWLISG